MNKQEIPEAVIENLRLLASPFDIQVATFPRGVVLADEVALSFHDVLLVWDPVVRSEAIQGMFDLDARLDAMSGPEHAEKWSDEALAHSTEWAALRCAAMEILRKVGCEWRRPDRKKLNLFVERE